MDRRIEQYLHASGLAGRDPRIVPLTGDASDRQYFRLLFPESESMVLALHAGPIEFASLPFANVAELLHTIPLPVPAILGHSDVSGVIVLEDLGDVTLQAHLGAAPATEHAGLYREAVALVELLQRRGAELTSDRFIPYRIAFDADKLLWELNFFVKHFLEGYRRAPLTASQRLALEQEWTSIANELASERRVLCHRDYHSRNLMLHRGQLYIIDFQDARLGPDTYDLASLLRDSYVDISDRDLDDLIAYFLALRRGTAIQQPERDGHAQEFRRRFDLMALQRNLKALGTFGYQTMARGNPVYIQYMPRTLRYARANLEKYPRFDRLGELLSTHLEELR
jgi:aminoglycoside/choline kinase family phosphotransferase